MRVFVLAQAYHCVVGSVPFYSQNFVYMLNINKYLSMHVKSPMQIGTGRVDPGELTQGRVDLGN